MDVMIKLHKILKKRAVFCSCRYSSRKNLIVSVLYLLLSLPLAIVIFPACMTRAVLRRRISVCEFMVDSEFAHAVQMFEFVRGRPKDETAQDLVIIRSRFRYKGLAFLYSKILNLNVLWSNGFAGLYSQALLLQPGFCVEVRQLWIEDAWPIADNSVIAPRELIAARDALLTRLNIKNCEYVLLSLHTAQYDSERTPNSARKESILESCGADLTEAIVALQNSRISVVRVGGVDSRASRIPAQLPRLEEFGTLGGVEEVALASGCNYFWVDDDGAWWLGAAHQKPVLFTNLRGILIKRGLQPRSSLHVPLRFQTPDGRDLTFKQLLPMRSEPYKQARAGQLRVIRNTADEILAANREMIERVSGLWRESTLEIQFRKRLREIWESHPDINEHYAPGDFSMTFLERYPQLLE